MAIDGRTLKQQAAGNHLRQQLLAVNFAAANRVLRSLNCRRSAGESCAIQADYLQFLEPSLQPLVQGLPLVQPALPSSEMAFFIPP